MKKHAEKKQYDKRIHKRNEDTNDISMFIRFMTCKTKVIGGTYGGFDLINASLSKTNVHLTLRKRTMVFDMHSQKVTKRYYASDYSFM